MNEIDYYNMEESAAWGKVLEGLNAAAENYDTGRWQWDAIDISLTDKDADLEPWGNQGIEFKRVDEDGVLIVVHGCKTICGDDVCLNEPEGFDEDLWDKARNIYVDRAQLVVQDAGSDGYWSGDDWALVFREEALVPWPEDTEDYDAMVKAIVEKAEEMIKPWEEKVALADKVCGQIAGWRDSNGEECEEGKPDMECSVFNPVYWDNEDE